jgi:elongation factor P--beta-lysine ligase
MANCARCKKKLGFLEGDRSASGRVCEACFTEIAEEIFQNELKAGVQDQLRVEAEQKRLSDDKNQKVEEIQSLLVTTEMQPDIGAIAESW